jgi:hypothetical protein
MVLEPKEVLVLRGAVRELHEGLGRVTSELASLELEAQRVTARKAELAGAEGIEAAGRAEIEVARLGIEAVLARVAGGA